jgi:hypothetical protein
MSLLIKGRALPLNGLNIPVNSKLTGWSLFSLETQVVTRLIFLIGHWYLWCVRSHIGPSGVVTVFVAEVMLKEKTKISIFCFNSSHALSSVPAGTITPKYTDQVPVHTFQKYLETYNFILSLFSSNFVLLLP